MKRLVVTAAAIVAFTGAPLAQRAPAKPLDIYVVDTEGGKAALWVTPSGQSLLIDSGNPGNRDLDRIMAAVSDAGLKQIDFLISTHYHVDHIGGLLELSKRIPIAHYIDHGPNVEEREQVQGFQAAYAELYGKAKHTVVKPGDKVPITGLDWRIVTSAGSVLKAPLIPGSAKPNPACTGVAAKDASPTDDNAQSVGSVITFGQFRAIDLGDLLWNKENELVCPNDPIGAVDVYFVTHHGLDASGSPALVHAVQPRVAVMQNGTRKGGGVEAIKTMRSSPGFEDLWQLHWSYNAGLELNSAGVFIANIDDPATVANVLTAPPRGGGPGGGGRGGQGGAPGNAPAGTISNAPIPTSPVGGAAPPAGVTPPGATQAPSSATPPPLPGAGVVPAPAPGGGGGGRGGGGAAAHTPAYWIKLSVQPDGAFTVTNTRNGFSKTYTKRK
ncbi:MAG TPA: MBL fold metallo-hydrolase [Vicinamibacterales bacterium]|nr:MBL fold metallo-hydrolase [Vicinamibacterales bacterium]